MYIKPSSCTLYIYHFLELGLNKVEKVAAHIRVLKAVQGNWRDGIGVKTIVLAEDPCGLSVDFHQSCGLSKF